MANDIGPSCKKRSETVPPHQHPPSKETRPQGQILAVCVLAAKLPNSNLNFAVDFGWIFSCFFGQKLKGSFLPGVVFAKGWQFPLVSLGEGFRVGFRGVAGVVLLWKMREKGKGVGRVGGGVGTAKGTGKSTRMHLSKLPFSDLPFSLYPIFSRKKARKKIYQKISRKIHPGLCWEKFPSDFCRSLVLIIHAQYDWATRVLENGNEWRKFRAVPRL